MPCTSTRRSTPWLARQAADATGVGVQRTDLCRATARAASFPGVHAGKRSMGSRYYLQCGKAEGRELERRSLLERVAQPSPRSRKRVNAWSPGRRWRRASRPCAASWQSRCASAACSWPATQRTSPGRGRQGLNLATADVGFLSRALEIHYREQSTSALDRYSELCLRRVWKAERFSWWFTSLMHHFPDNGEFGQKIQEAEPRDFHLRRDLCAPLRPRRKNCVACRWNRPGTARATSTQTRVYPPMQITWIALGESLPDPSSAWDLDAAPAPGLLAAGGGRTGRRPVAGSLQPRDLPVVQ